MFNIVFRFLLSISCILSLNAAVIEPLESTLNVSINIESSQELADEPNYLEKKNIECGAQIHAQFNKLYFVFENINCVGYLKWLNDTNTRQYTYQQQLAYELSSNDRNKRLAFLPFSSEPS